MFIRTAPFLSPVRLSAALLVLAFAVLAAQSPTAAHAYVPATPLVAPGSGHTCVLQNSGAVQCWGYNLYGQLGDGTNTDSPVPVDVYPPGANVKTIVSTNAHTCALFQSGALECWGYNLYGQLGIGISGAGTDVNVPTGVVGLGSGVAAVSATGNHTCAILDTGALKCWGYNFYGQLGIGVTGGSRNTPVDVSGMASGVVEVATGPNHTCARLDTGVVQCWGDNDYGQLGNSANSDTNTPVTVTGLASGVVALTVGLYHSCALLDTGSVQCWGYNVLGALGDGTNTDSNVPVNVTGLAAAVESVDAGLYHVCALLVTKAVQCWGYNLYGQLGNASNTNSNVPVSVTGLGPNVIKLGTGGNSNCVLLATGALKCWGRNDHGQLGSNGTTDSNVPLGVPVVDLIVPLPPYWAVFSKISYSNTLQPGAPDYVPGTWATSRVGIYIRCTPVDAPIDIDRADHNVSFNDGVHLYSTRPNDECIDDDGDAAEPIVDFGPIMVDTRAPSCDVSPSNLKVKRTETDDVSFVLTYSDATSGIGTVIPSYTASGGAIVNSTSGPDGTTFNVTMPNSTAGRIDAAWAITDVAGNVAVCKGTIRAK